MNQAEDRSRGARAPATQALGLRWLVAAWLAVTLAVGALAQTSEPAADGQGQGQRIRVTQTIWTDESQQMGFESVITQDFKPFNHFERMPIGNEVVWLRMHMAQVHGDAGPLLLSLLPPHLSDVTLYSPALQEPGRWHKRALEPQELIANIALGQAAQGSDFYLRIASPHNAAVLAFVGEQDDIHLHEKKLLALATFFMTVLLLALLVMLWRLIRKFSWMLVVLIALDVAVQCQITISLGYFYTVFGFPLALGENLLVPTLVLALGAGGSLYALFITALFPNQRWLRWLWGWSVLNPMLLVSALVTSRATPEFDSLFVVVAAGLSTICLIVAAIREPGRIRPLPNLVAFALLLLACFLFVNRSLNAAHILNAPAAELATDLLVRNLLFRFSGFVLLLALASWVFGRISADRLNSLRGALQQSNESLELESKRLERQRRFTAMLAHELRNPLATSRMALSSIETRLGADDPLLERAASIKQSLRDIDSIIERCSEIDGFEHGEMPMSIGTFTVSHFLALVKVANPSERIYSFTRGIKDDASITSDIHYLKIIFNNLLTNALKYSPPESLVEIAIQSTMSEGGHKALTFSISNEVGKAGTPNPSKVFDRFYRAEAARSQSGAGLGLWLSQALANALDSEVVMQHDGSRITFSLTLPYA